MENLFSREQQDELYYEEYKKEIAYINAERDEQHQRELFGEFLPNVSFSRSNKAIERTGLYVRRLDIEPKRSSNSSEIPGVKNIQ